MTSTSATLRNDDEIDDNIQHGIDDDPTNDVNKAEVLGGLGGGTVGAIAGAAAGPLGAIAGALIGGALASAGSGVAVNEIDKRDNDNSITGIGREVTTDVETTTENALHNTGSAVGGALHNTGAAISGAVHNTGAAIHDAVTPDHTRTSTTLPDTAVYNTTGTGVVPAHSAADTRGVGEKIADAVTGDRIDDKTGKRVV